MTSSRRAAVDVSGNRKALLDAAQALMVEEGYGAVTTRRVAAKAGLKPQLVHYYFESMDDLLLYVVRRATARTRAAIVLAGRCQRCSKATCRPCPQPLRSET